jgi:ArsR family transcriptional regulator, nickel/cobalt-responsive transcriptional repressor
MKPADANKECADRLKALADHDRLRIVQVLRGGPRNVSELTAELNAEIANVSHHLQILKRERIVDTKKQGRFVVYRLHPEVFEATRSSADCLDLGCCRLELPKERPR